MTNIKKTRKLKNKQKNEDIFPVKITKIIRRLIRTRTKRMESKMVAAVTSNDQLCCSKNNF